MDVDEHRQRGILAGVGVNTLTLSVDSPGTDGSGMSVTPGSPRCAVAPYSSASRTPSHGPVRHGSREAQLADGRLGERDPEEGSRCAALAGFARQSAAHAAGRRLDLDEGAGGGR